MTERIPPLPDDRIRSGRRLAVDIDAPRDRTVCFMVSEEERQAVDALAASVSRTRSALLVRIATAFIKDAESHAGAENIQELLQQVRSGKLPREISTNRR